MIPAITSFRPGKRHLAIGAATLVLLAVAAGALLYATSPAAGVHARIDLKNTEHVRVNQPVPIRFDQAVDLSKARVTVEPAVPVQVAMQHNRIVVSPQKGWDPTKRYTIQLADVSNAKHEARLQSWSGSFFTQPRVGINSVSVDGHAADPKAVQVTPRSKLQVTFTVSMKPSTVNFMVGDQPLPPSGVQWQPDNQTAVLAVPVKALYAPIALSVAPSAESSYGDPFTDTAAATLLPVALEPVNTSSGIDASFKPVNPIEIVVENSGPARPQRGLQQADIVYEYVSEYSISRLTAIYFNRPPDVVGPVRSCRMINPYLGFAFGGYTMCSGASVGTLHFMFLDQPIWVPGSINDFDQGNHFFRSGIDGHFGPHNLFTAGDRAVGLRQSWPIPPPAYALDPPHPDVEAGDPANSIDVPVHHVSWTYDGGSKQYRRLDSGTPFIEASTGAQLEAKNVVLIHVPFHDAGWIEDDNGGAHSVWYDMLGSGPAEILSDGRIIGATWHMGNPGQSFFDNHNPVWFTDANGNVVQLNSGLTWIHVVGNGQ